jgi:hypothetical protein
MKAHVVASWRGQDCILGALPPLDYGTSVDPALGTLLPTACLNLTPRYVQPHSTGPLPYSLRCPLFAGAAGGSKGSKAVMKAHKEIWLACCKVDLNLARSGYASGGPSAAITHWSFKAEIVP